MVTAVVIPLHRSSNAEGSGGVIVMAYTASVPSNGKIKRMVVMVLKQVAAGLCYRHVHAFHKAIIIIIM
jgi:hypothetical protein